MAGPPVEDKDCGSAENVATEPGTPPLSEPSASPPMSAEAEVPLTEDASKPVSGKSMDEVYAEIMAKKVAAGGRTRKLLGPHGLL